MKKAVKMMSLAALLVGMSFGAQAQFRQSVFFNINAPTGDFVSKVTAVADRPILATPVAGQSVPLGYNEIGKSASIGFGLGYRVSYRFDVGMGMVAPYLQADIFWNSIDSKLSDEYRAVRADKIPTYLNIPVQLGVSYLYDQLWNDITPFAEFGIGLDGMLITSEGPCHWTDALGNTVDSKEYSYKPSFAVAYSLGIGAYFGRHVSAGIYYYGLGEHTIDYTQKTIDNNLVDIPYVGGQRTYYMANPAIRSIGSFALRIGFHF